MNKLKQRQSERIEDLLPFIPSTAGVSLLSEKVKGDEEAQKKIAHILDYHKQHRLGKEHEIETQLGNSRIRLLPSRGSVVTDLTLEGKHIFYHDREATEDMTRSLRGSFWMIPYAGPAPKSNHNLQPLQHGYGRISERKQHPDGELTLNTKELAQQEIDKQVFMGDLDVSQHAYLQDHAAHFVLQVHNKGIAPLPCAPGFHAYYAVPADQKGKVIVQGSGIPQEELSHYLTEGIGKNDEKVLKFTNEKSPIYLSIPGTGTLCITIPRTFSHVWIRTEKDKPFVCLEPVARGDSAQPLSTIQPKETKRYAFSIKLHKGL